MEMTTCAAPTVAAEMGFVEEGGGAVGAGGDDDGESMVARSGIKVAADAGDGCCWLDGGR